MGLILTLVLLSASPAPSDTFLADSTKAGFSIRAFSGSAADEEREQALKLLNEFFSNWRKTQTATYRLRKIERMRDGRAIEEQAFVKLRKPLAVYVAALAPAQGQEILYDAAKDPDTFLVHPGRFPDVTLRLSVRGSLATADQHHTLSHSGMDYLVEIIGRMMREPGVEVTLCNAFRASGRPVHCVLLNAATARARYVRARPEETLFELAERTGAAPYLILYLNPSVEELTTELDPVAYLVPSTYGKRVELALDAESHLLVRVRVWDWGGRLYEQLEFNELRVNPELCDEDFDPENPEYDF